jgi:hypothetical protein
LRRNASSLLIDFNTQPATLFSPALRAHNTVTTTTFVGVKSSLGPSRPWNQAHSPLTSRANRALSSALSTVLNTMSEGKKTEYEEEIELAETAKLNENFSLPPSREASPAIMPQSTSSKALDLNSPVLAVLSYCGSSILMTVSNKYMVNGTGFNLPFVLLVVQVS